ncbi:uncharacterized protein K452DRAFT_233802 [Aplosporella prunicola CBS 121167]|uniref:Altered inheritance of mitochondria protein 6 n=1 Tax=Aplosporella prunicola CBS 121167 TaxID=1176127 RepID=A0A6A6B5X3_9PEZI|nr:uncharacterized protein K452DRAFT_233802 [Aplosporella prunicola CBS 121167]KAF2138654.1 hypothetical protein K452DRAFT_233802 [Aplosporella prunicola CBS 121167]
MAGVPQSRNTFDERDHDGSSNVALLDGKCKSYPKPYHHATRRRRWTVWTLLALPILLLCFGSTIYLTSLIIILSPIRWDEEAFSTFRQWGQPGHLGTGFSGYTANFTHNVRPIPCHSHNDYWRRVPLFEALSYGCSSVEADVWRFDSELYVGHSTRALQRQRTFSNLYVEPLVALLNARQTNASSAAESDSARPVGVWDRDPAHPLVLLVDFKNSGRAIWPLFIAQLEPLRARNYLTHFDGENVVPGPVTVVATGDAHFDLAVANATYRDVFLDAPLAAMADGSVSVSSTAGAGHAPASLPQGLPANPDLYNPTNSYYASASFSKTVAYLLPFPRFGGGSGGGQLLSPSKLKILRGQIGGAHRRGLKVRYWGTPAWPHGLRRAVWDMLVGEGADYLNVDDLAEAAGREWRSV